MEVQVVEYFQSFANKFWDSFFWLITKIGEETFFFIVLMALYLCYDKKFAFKFLYFYVINISINNVIKFMFRRPRPHVAYDSVSNRLQANGYSFPSGHSQGYFSIATVGMLEINKKNKSNIFKLTALIIMCVVGILVMFSRLYWGQHFLSDVIFGMIFGILFTFVIQGIIKLIPSKIKDFFKGKKLYAYVGVLTILIYLGLLFFEFVFGIVSRKVYKFVGVTLAMTLGYFTDEKYIHYDSRQGFWVGVLKFLIAAIVAAVLYMFAELFLIFIPFIYFAVYFVITLILTTLLPLLFKKIFKNKRGANGDGSCK